MKTKKVEFPLRVYRGVATKDGKLFYTDFDDDDFHFIALPKWVEKAISDRDDAARQDGMKLNRMALQQALGINCA